MLPPPPRSTLFPYTTLFRSSWCVLAMNRGPALRLAGADAEHLFASEPCSGIGPHPDVAPPGLADRKSTRLNSSHVAISYAVFCLKKKNEAMSSYVFSTH